MKVYTVDRFTRTLALIGWAALNLFVESGTQAAPTSDRGGVQLSLNEGAHQIRLFHRAPPTDRPFSVESLASSGRVVPCATLLLQIRKGKSPLQPEPPDYSRGVYFSDSARPTPGESRLYTAMLSRSVVQVREVIPRGQELMSDTQLSDWLQKTFNEKMKEGIPRAFPLCCVSQYDVMCGAAIAVDSAHNLPWSGFTLAHICFSPPAALYYGAPWMRYDRAVPVDDLDLQSDPNCPVWEDGFKTFTRRIFQKYLTVVVHLQEVRARGPEEGGRGPEQAGMEAPVLPEFRSGSQAWTAMRVFYRRYCELGVFQLPLYRGAPTLSVLHALSSGDCRATLRDLEQRGLISRVEAASATVRITDGRRKEELMNYNAQDINQTYLPEDAIDSYSARPSGRKVSELIPAAAQQGFKRSLAHWYRKYLKTYRSAEEEVTTSRDRI